MSRFAWGAPEYLWLLGAVPAMAALMAWAARRRARAVALLAVRLAGELNARRRRLRAALLVAACGFAVLALARPSWDAPKPAASKGRDIVVLLDVSRSMLARDLPENRLDFARRGIAQFAARAGGDRIALAAFAGTAALRCPLTKDHDFFRTALEGASPESVAVGGTEIARAVRVAMKDGFDDLAGRSKHILLVTDAEDHGHAAASAAAEARRAGIRLSAAGLGDEVGAPVPGAMYRGQEVRSKLNAPAIRRIAEAGGGEAFVVGARAETDLGAALAGMVSGARGRPERPRVEGFWIPLLLAAVCLGAETALSERRRA